MAQHEVIHRIPQEYTNVEVAFMADTGGGISDLVLRITEVADGRRLEALLDFDECDALKAALDSIPW